MSAVPCIRGKLPVAKRKKARGTHENLTFLLAFHQAKLRALIEFSAIEFSAAIQAGDRAPDSTDPGKRFSAAGALVKVTAGAALHRKRQRMRARFVADPQITAGLAPFGTVRRETAAARAKLGEEMREFVAQGAIDFARVMFAQARV